jgi:hypothetical protein
MANQMMDASPAKASDYIGMYEQALRDVVQACGSRETANLLIFDLQNNYRKTEKDLEGIEKLRSKDPEAYVKEKMSTLARAKHDVNHIIELHVPHLSDHVRELIIGTSLATLAITLPAAFTTLAVATSVAAIGGSYYIGFKLLRDWRAMAGKEKVTRFAGVVGPKDVGGAIKVVRWAGKK